MRTLALLLLCLIPSNDLPEDITGTWIANERGRACYAVLVDQHGDALRSQWVPIGGGCPATGPAPGVSVIPRIWFGAQ